MSEWLGMSYTIRSTEKLSKSGADAETKALLYLMSFYQDCDKIYYFIVDLFNDLTGMDKSADHLWDVQSKAKKTSGPGEIGQSLITLFKNYMSEFDFTAYILFIGGVPEGLRKNNSLNVFGVENICDKSVKRIKAGLIKEGKKKTYIDDSLLVDDKITEFLSKITIVVDDGKQPSEYVKAIIQKYPKIIPNDEVLTAIFNEIRSKQAGKKYINVVEGEVIDTADRALEFCRHLTSNEIHLMVLNRLINSNPLIKAMPIAFNEIYNQWPPEERQQKLDECKSTLCCALFNKSAKDAFWYIFENIYLIVSKNKNISIQEVYIKLKKIRNCLTRHPDFDVLSIKYLIALIIDGVQR